MKYLNEVRRYFKSERVRNNIFKMSIFSLMSLAVYIGFNIGKPVGAQGQKRWLEGE